MKRTLAFFLAMVMLLGMLPMSVFADDTLSATIRFEHDVEDVTALKKGDTFNVTAYLGNNPGFSVFEFDLEWDNSVVRFDGYATDTYKGKTVFDSYIFDPTEYNDENGKIVFGASDNTETTEPAETDYMFIAKFTVVGDGDPKISYDKETFLFRHSTGAGAFADINVSMDMSALENLNITHICDYSYSEVVTPPTCTEQGYTTRTCACGKSIKDTYIPATGHTPSEDDAGKCGVCGTAITVIPDGASFIEMVTSDNKPVTITDVGDYYKVEVPLGTTKVDVVYSEGTVQSNGMGFSVSPMIGFDGVGDDGYQMGTSNGKTTVGLFMEKVPANLAPTTLKLLNVPYGENPRRVGITMTDGTVEYFAFTYQLGEGQYFAALPEGIGYTVTGDPVASNGYTFEVEIEDGYEATESFAVRVNGQDIQPGENGTYTLETVSQDIVITVVGVSKIVNETDVSVTFDLTGYTGSIDSEESYMVYQTTAYAQNQMILEAGKSMTLAYTASDLMYLEAFLSGVSPNLIGYEINGTEYYLPASGSQGYNFATGVNVTLYNTGDCDVKAYSEFSWDTWTDVPPAPCILVIKPIVTSSESLGSAPDFVESDVIDVTDISVIGVNVVNSSWDGDTLNVVLAEDTAADATIQTAWTFYGKNTFEGAFGAGFNFNGSRVRISSAEGTAVAVVNTTLAEGTATAELLVEPCGTEADAMNLYFTPKTFTVNFYVSGKEPAPEPEQPVSNPIQAVEAKNPLLNKTSAEDAPAPIYSVTLMSGVTEDLLLDITGENPDKEATQQLTWSSTKPNVAWVENGKLFTGTVTESTTVTLTATVASEAAAAAIDGEGSDALITLNVTVEPANNTQFQVSMDTDKTVDVLGSTDVNVSISHTDTAQVFKAFELVFNYDPTLLRLNTKGSETDTRKTSIVDDNGTVTVRSYGAANEGAALTLNFTALTIEDASVELKSAKVGTSEDAQTEDIPDAQIQDSITLIDVKAFEVTLDNAFTGEGVADPSEEYTFTAKDKNYIYTVDVTVTKPDGTTDTFEITDEDKDGILTISADKITGSIKIEVDEENTVGKTFDVTIDDDTAAVTGSDKAQYMTDYVLTAAEGVDLTGYTIKYKIGDGEEKTMSNLTIPGSEITGDITITVTAPGTDPEDPDRPANSWKITFEGNGKDDVQVDSYYVTKDQPYTFQIDKAEGYTYIVTYTGADGVVELPAAEDGTYTITPTADMTITVMKWNVEVNQYVSLNGKAVFLVSVAEAKNVGLKYDGNAMYVKSVNALGEDDKYTGEAADKYVYLVEQAEGTLTVDAAARKLSIVENVTCENIEKTFNVNGSSNLDINDAQLVYDMYNNVYQSIATEKIGMLKFLKADINCDRTIGVQDAAAVVNEILK